MDKENIYLDYAANTPVDPDDVSCVESVENGTREITLITCTNGHKNRLVTKARQIL